MILAVLVPWRWHAVRVNPERCFAVPVKGPSGVVGECGRGLRRGVWVWPVGVVWEALGVDQARGFGREQPVEIVSEELGEWRV